MQAKTTFVTGYNPPWIESPFGKPLSVNCERVLACLYFGAQKASGLRQSIPELEQYSKFDGWVDVCKDWRTDAEG